MKNILVIASSLLFCVALATAQAPQAPPVTPMKFAYYPATDLKALATTLKSGGQIKFNRLHRGDHDFQGMSFRAKSAGGPEMHNNWADLYYILDGEVLHHTGGTLEGGTERNPGTGEFGGGKIVGAKAVRLAAGDIASSAAGVPHWWEVEAGKTVTYMTVKILKQTNLHTATSTPTQWAHYKAADLKAFVDTLKRGETIKFPSIHRGDHQFQNISHRAKSSGGAELHRTGPTSIHPRRRAAIRTAIGSGAKARRRSAQRRIVGNVTRQKLAAGDVASAPAGVPHFWKSSLESRSRKLTVKLGKKH